MKRTIFYLTFTFVVSQFFCVCLEAGPTTGEEAAMVVRGWLRADPRPFGAEMGRDVAIVEAFTNQMGDILYYIVSLDPSGFVIVPSDDRVEPIMGFSQSGTYHPSPDNPLAALVANDIKRRLFAAVVSEQLALIEDSANGDVTAATGAQETENQLKWRRLIELATAVPAEMWLASITTDQIDDLRVAPLLKTRWDQTTCWTQETDEKGTHTVDSGAACYNFYTPPSDPGDPCDYLVPAEYSGVRGTYGDPNNYPSGCVATSMAQVMRYHQWPQEGIGKQEFDIQVKYGEQWQPEKAWTRGGDGQGGPYDWPNMLGLPECDDPRQLKAIGALCYDAGISIGMEYSPDGSGPPDALQVSTALTQTFSYRNAIAAVKAEDGKAVEIGATLTQMINPNLDAGMPVILGIEGQQGGHSVICDGYGFDSSAIYYHLNMGWASYPQECATIWYQLIPPDIAYYCTWCECAQDDPNCQCPNCWYQSETDWSYDTVVTCIYNIFPENSGEIISGRVLDSMGNPVAGVPVFAESTDDPNDLLSDQTDPNGIFAFTGCQSQTEYTVSADLADANYPILKVRTGTSMNRNANVGNVADLELRASMLYVPDDFPTIQGAIDVSGDGQVIIVRAGTYTGEGNRDIDFKGKAIALFGEGGPGACIIDCQASGDERHRAFYFHTRETSASVVGGFTVVNGYQDKGGAVNCSHDSDPTIRNCMFRDNFAVSKGGAFYNYDSDPTITACTFTSNSAGLPGANTGDGGAISNVGSSPAIFSSLFTANTAQNSGGAIYNESFRKTVGCTPSEIGCTLQCHRICCSWQPGPNGIWVCTGMCDICSWTRSSSQSSRPRLKNCTFVANTSPNGAALDMISGWMTLENCIVWDNLPEQLTTRVGLSASYSNVQGGRVGDGNIDADPLFVDPANGDYRLQENSPCVNAGNPDSLMETFEFETDRDGNPRIAGDRVDMGAYEF